MSEQQVIVGDCQEVLRGMEAESVQVCVTSPPYWNLRDYGVDGQLGLESTPEEYLATMVNVFREVRRVLRKDGTLWLNMGDKTVGKQLLGIPWRLALALQTDGWWLRMDNVWNKLNPTPKKEEDRPMKVHEYVFLLSKAYGYYYDPEAAKEPVSPKTLTVHTTPRKGTGVESAGEKLNKWMENNGGRRHSSSRRVRSVWNISTQSFKGKHFAAYPERLAETCILLGTSDRGCCRKCKAPWKRVTEKNRVPTRPGKDNVSDTTGMANRDEQRHVTEVRTTGWAPTCECTELGNLADDDGGCQGLHDGVWQIHASPIPCKVLDIFCGSGTTGVVARKLGRDFIGIELSEEYAEMARKRIANPHPEPEVPDMDGQLTFGGAPDD